MLSTDQEEGNDVHTHPSHSTLCWKSQIMQREERKARGEEGNEYWKRRNKAIIINDMIVYTESFKNEPKKKKKPTPKIPWNYQTIKQGWKPETQYHLH